MNFTTSSSRLIALVLAITLCFSFCLPGCAPQAAPEQTSAPQATEPAAASLSKKDVPLLIGQEEAVLSLAFADSAEQIPLISIDDGIKVLTDHIQANRDSSYTLTATAQDSLITLTRDNGASCILDFDAGTMTFSDYNAFHMFSYELGALDILEATGLDADGQNTYFQRVLSSEKPGKTFVVELKQRNIPMLLEGSTGYMTLQTFSDLFLTPHEVILCYNQSQVLLLDGEGLNALPESYYGADIAQPTQELLELRYQQLCLMLDVHYGLQQEHGIQSADTYLTQLGLKEELCSPDHTVSFSALKTLFYKYLSDNHSNVMTHSVFQSEPNYSLSAQEASIGYWEFYKNYQLYNSGRANQFAEGYQPYQELGNTAFVTFDKFTSTTQNYYEAAPTADAIADEIGLICYAHSQITRQDSPIENVVIDLSTNTGGHMDGGIFLTAWVLGNAIIHIADPVREAEGTFLYRADVNLDREFDSADTISDKNIFVIVSPITFSCANYAAYAFQESGKVTVLGTTSGGGTCCVYLASTLDGGAVTLSSALRISGYKNGTYYSLDGGIVPDVKFAKLSDFFDRQRILQIIDGLV